MGLPFSLVKDYKIDSDSLNKVYWLHKKSIHEDLTSDGYFVTG